MTTLASCAQAHRLRTLRFLPRGVAVLLCAAVASGCLSSAPSWTDGEPPEAPEWPSTRYLLIRGSGEDAAMAEARAREELARRLEPSSSGSAQASQNPLIRRVREMAASPPDSIVARARVAEVWTDPDGRTTYVLLALERAPVARPMYDAVSEKSSLARYRLHRAHSAPDALARVRTLAEALYYSVERDVLYARYGVVTGAWTHVDKADTTHRVEAELRNALHETRFEVDASRAGNAAGQKSLYEAVARALGSFGFGVLPRGTRGAVAPRVRADLSVHRAPAPPSGGAAARWDVAFEVSRRPPSRAVVVAGRHTGDVQAADAAQARAQARADAERVLARELVDRLVVYLAPDVPDEEEAP